MNAVYEKTNDNFGATALAPLAAAGNVLGHRAYYFSGKYNFGANAVKLAYGNAGANATANTGVSQVSIGLDHSLSKRTTVYAQYTQLSNNAGATYALSGNGTGAPVTAGAGAKPTAMSFGLKHTF